MKGIRTGLFIALSLICLGQASSLQPSEAYRQYAHRPRTEFSKLIYLLDRFRSTDFMIVFDGITYDAKFALKFAKKYLAQNYKKEKAESWIKIHAYRTPGAGRIILMKFADGRSRPLRDVLLEELSLLEQVEKSNGV